MKSFLYTVATSKCFEAAVDAVEQKTVEKGFRVVHTYDVAATLAAEGFNRGPLKIIEVCNARFADEALKKDVNVALMLPCPIMVHAEGEQTYISTMRPSSLTAFSPDSGLEEIASQVEKTVLEIIDEAQNGEFDSLQEEIANSTKGD